MTEISKYVSITKAKNDLLELIRQGENVDESVAVTKNGIPTAVILSMEKYTGLLETLDILSDEDTDATLHPLNQTQVLTNQHRESSRNRITLPADTVCTLPRFRNSGNMIEKPRGRG